MTAAQGAVMGDEWGPCKWKIGDIVGFVDIAGKSESATGEAAQPENWPLRWYAVLTKPGAEGVAESNIIEQGYCCFYPKRLVDVILAGSRKRQKVPRPYYPRYVFAGVPVGRLELGPVYSTRGVSTVLHDADGPMLFRKTVGGHGSLAALERLMRIANEDGVVEIADKPPEHDFAEGMVVGFKRECVFCDFTGTISRVDSSGMIKVLIEAFGNYREVEVHHSQLKAPE